MPITYSCIAHQRRILTEVGPQSNVISALLQKLPAGTATKKSYEYEGQFYHLIVSEDDLVFLCLADSDMAHRICYSFLQEVKNRFMAQYGFSYSTAKAGSLSDFSRILKEQMDYYSYDPTTDTVKKVRGQIEDVKHQMHENIEKVLERGDKIEVLVDKTENLQTEGNKFKTVAKSVKRKMWWQNKKTLLAGICCVVLVIAIIVVAALFIFKILPPN